MSKALAAHWPHLIFVAIGIAAFVWVAYRPERGADGRTAYRPEHGADGRTAGPRPVETVREPARLADPAPQIANVRRSVARRGLLALGPLLGTGATGAILYGLDVGGGAVPGAVIWIHSGISALALLLVVYKVLDLRPAPLARIRRALHRDRLPELVSVVLGILSVPLAVTGVGLLFAPSTSSFFAYSHLISSAWWTGLLVWHLRRYVGASLRAAFRKEQTAPVSADRGRFVPVEPRVDRIRWRTSGD